MKTRELQQNVKYNLETLETVFGNQKRVANVLNVDRSQITMWHKKNMPDNENTARILGLAFVIAKLLSHFRHVETMTKWLEGVNDYLGNQKPIDLIRQNRYADVIAAIDHLITGAYS